MAGYKNYQSDNQKYGTRNRDNYNPAFTSTINSKSKNQQTIFEKNLHKWIDFISWARFYPDLLLDLLKPQTGGINLHFDQRVFLRCVVRFVSMYGVFPRGWGKTWDEVIAGILCCMLFPGIEIALTAQTKQNAASMLEAKYNEICKQYPLIKNEIIKPNFSKDTAYIPFVNGSSLDILANSQQSKGQRRRRLAIEEAALLDNVTFEDALEPIVEVGRATVGELGVINPEELNQQINFFTTSGFRGSDEFMRSINMISNMRDLKGEIVLGSNWMLGCWYGRGSTKQQILKKKKRMSSIAFAQNYESRWVGATDDALVDVNKLLRCRNLTNAEYEAKEEDEYYLGVDVARSQGKTNNRSSVAAIRVIRNDDKTVKELQLTHLYLISNALTFDAQIVEVKRIQKLFKAKAVCMDTNGLGAGLLDAALKTNRDEKTGESYPCWKTINTDHKAENDNAIEMIYALTPQSAQSRITVNFMELVESGKLRLLEKKDESLFSSLVEKGWEIKYAPYIQTDSLIEEITNLKLKHLNNGGVTIEKLLRKIDKDRYSAVAYGLWYIMEFCNQPEDNSSEKLLDFIKSTNTNSISSNSKTSYFKFK